MWLITCEGSLSGAHVRRPLSEYVMYIALAGVVMGPLPKKAMRCAEIKAKTSHPTATTSCVLVHAVLLLPVTPTQQVEMTPKRVYCEEI